MVLKGPIIAAKIYENPVLRIFGDTDLLIEGNSRDQVERILKEEGYQPNIRAKSMEGWREKGASMKFVKPASPLLKRPELEFHVQQKMKDDEKGFLENSVRVQVANHDCLFPCNEHLLLYFLLHADQHARNFGGFPWIILRRFADINEHIHSLKSILDWSRFVDFVNSNIYGGGLFSAYYPLYFTELLYGRQVPDWVMDEIRPQDADKEKDLYDPSFRIPFLTEEKRIYWKSDFISRLFNLQREQEILEVYSESLTNMIRFDKVKGWDRTIKIVFPKFKCTLIIQDGKCTYHLGLVGEADITVEMSFEQSEKLQHYHPAVKFDLLKLAEGGLIKTTGSMSDIQKLVEAFTS